MPNTGQRLHELVKTGGGATGEAGKNLGGPCPSLPPLRIATGDVTSKKLKSTFMVIAKNCSYQIMLNEKVAKYNF